MTKINLHILLFIILSLSLSAKDEQIIIVDKNDSGDYATITEAVDALPMFVYDRIIIFIKNGIYEERVKIEQDNITLIGENREETIIQYNLPRSEWEGNKDHIGPGIINIEGDDLILENLTVKNTQPEIGLHAFAVYGTGTRTIITNCNLVSKGADTVALWDYKTGMYYHSNCYFEGAVDFVCPRGWCYIKDSQFYEVKETAAVWHAGGFDKTQKLVVVNSSFDGVEGFKLGRHHYEAQFYFIDCKFSGNMVDEPIYRVTYEDTTRNRQFNWGHRYYFHNVFGEGSNYAWLQNNLNISEEVNDVKELTPAWTYNHRWDPEKQIPTILPDSLK